MDAATNVTKEDTKEKIQTLIETSIIKKRQTKQGLDLLSVQQLALTPPKKTASVEVSVETSNLNQNFCLLLRTY